MARSGASPRSLARASVLASRLATVLHDQDGRVVTANPAAERLLGRYRAELGDDLRVEVTGRDREAAPGAAFPDALRATVADVLGGAAALGRADLVVARAVGDEIVVRATVVPLPAAGQPLLGTATYLADVTDDVAIADLEATVLTPEDASPAPNEAGGMGSLVLRDRLTGLASRAGVELWLQRAADDAARHDGSGGVGVIVVDLDRFRRVNEAHGPDEGDRLLARVGRRLDETFGDDSFLGRISGDGFLVGCEDVSIEALLDTAARVHAELRTPFTVAGRPLRLTVTLGVAVVDGTRPIDVLRDADAAMHRGKEAGGDRVQAYDAERHLDTALHLQLESDLYDAFERGELVLHHQPVFSLDEAPRCTGYECLVRWEHPTLGELAPDRFVPLAEQSGLIVPLGGVVLRAAATSAAVAPHLGVVSGTVWCNVSGRQLERPAFVDEVLAALHGAGTGPDAFGIEVTESVLVEDDPDVAAALWRLSDAGVLVAIDDFGTGYSSLARLATYPVDLLKIDRSFVRDLPSSAARTLVAAITDLGHALGAAVCAEGVETAAHVEVLRELGVDRVCGYLLARPVPTAELPDAIATGERRLAAT